MVSRLALLPMLTSCANFTQTPELVLVLVLVLELVLVLVLELVLELELET